MKAKASRRGGRRGIGHGGGAGANGFATVVGEEDGVVVGDFEPAVGEAEELRPVGRAAGRGKPAAVGHVGGDGLGRTPGQSS